MTKEELIDGFKAKLENLSDEDLETIGVLCVVSDKDGVGEMMVGKGEEIFNALCHAFVNNTSLLTIADASVRVAKKYLDSEAKKEQVVNSALPFANNKYKS